MSNKIKLAVIDRNLRCKIGTYDISDTGDKIVIDPEKIALNPTFDVDSFLEIPRSIWKGGGYDKIYFMINGADTCINFKTPKMNGPDKQSVMRAAENEILWNMGKDEVKTPFWAYFIILILIGIALKVFGAI